MKMTKVDGHPGDDADKPEQRVVFLDWATCDNVSQWSVKNGFSHCRVKNQSCHRIKCDLLKPFSRKMQDQWKKELAQSGLPSKRKVPNTIRKYPKIPDYSENISGRKRKVPNTIRKYPKIPDYSENISGRVRVLLKNAVNFAITEMIGQLLTLTTHPIVRRTSHAFPMQMFWIHEKPKIHKIHVYHKVKIEMSCLRWTGEHHVLHHLVLGH